MKKVERMSIPRRIHSDHVPVVVELKEEGGVCREKKYVIKEKRSKDWSEENKKVYVESNRNRRLERFEKGN